VTSESENRPIIHTVLFDLDGVLIDSMPHHVRAWQEEFAAWGVQVDPLIFRLREGEKAAATLAFAAQEYGLVLTEPQAHQFVESKRHRYRKTAPKHLIEGAVDVLKTLRNIGIKTALVTGSIRRNLDHSISEDEQNLFDAIITADLCHHGKPDPEPYLRAVETLNMTPQHCLAVENAPLGIQSAKSAGVFVLALTSTLPTKYLKSANSIIDDLSDILHHGAYILKPAL
jgi:beta-phosphoglucomutase